MGSRQELDDNEQREYSKESGLYDVENKKVIGKFKDESPDEVIESFVGIRSKCYTFKTKNNVVKKAKVVSKVVVKKHISFDDYKNCVLKNEPKNVEAMLGLAEALKGLGEIEKAKQLLEECKKLIDNPAFAKDIEEYIKTF